MSESETLTVCQAAIQEKLPGNVRGKVYSLPRPGRHPNVRDVMRAEGYNGSLEWQGFLLSDGTFADRKRAAAVALAAGQIESLNWPPNLYSEDLW